MTTFADRLRARARQLGLSDAEVARRIGITERRYGHYVTGSREPNLMTLVAISQALAVTPNELLGGTTGEEKLSERTKLRERISAAANMLSGDELVIAAEQIEIIASHRRGASRTRKRQRR